MAMRKREEKRSERRSVTERIPVASVTMENIIGRDSGLTFLWSFPRESLSNRHMRQSRLRPEKLLDGLSGKEEPIRPCVPSHVA